MFTLIQTFNETDLTLGTVIFAGVVAGWLAWLLSPHKHRTAEGIKHCLFGIVFSLFSSIAFHLICGSALDELPMEMHYTFLWCASFLPSLVLSVLYGMFVRHIYRIAKSRSRREMA